METHQNFFSSDLKLGILGGGQLGKMLLAVTNQYDIYTKILDPSENAPCKYLCKEFVQGALDDYDTVMAFCEDCDLITIEIENINTDALKKLQEEGKMVYPKPQTLEIIKNKCHQKEFYRNHKIPTAPFFTFENLEEMSRKLIEGKFSPPFVWKAASGGYDGRGVIIVKDSIDVETLPEGPGLIEEMINFKTEIAVIAARNPDGEVKTYPVVEMEFHPTSNHVEYVFCPASISKKAENAAIHLAENLIENMDHIGILAVEMFLTENDELLVNEVAPRVHNSGHLTIESNVTSQFDQHLRSILNLPLGQTDITKPAVMVNLVGAKNHKGPVFYEGIEKVLDIPQTYIHLYGKTETKPFRKMGHVTITADNIEEARRKANDVKDTITVKTKDK